MRVRTSWYTFVAVAVAVAAGVGVGMPAAGAASRPAADPGITPTEVRVGGVASVTNPLNGPYGSSFEGAQAYFIMVNSQGGVNGRKIKLVSERDDQIANNAQQVQGLLAQDDVFAVIPVATIFSFSGAKQLADDKVPAFGWGINAEWTGPPNLYGLGGTNCLSCVTPLTPMISKLAGKKNIGILAYNVPNSKDCAEIYKNGYDKFATGKVQYMSTSLSFGETDFSAEVKAMKDKGVDFVETCIDQNGALALAKEMKKQGLNAVQYMPNAYDQQFMKANAAFFAGNLVHVAFDPFEFKPQPTGMKLFNKWMDKAKYKKNELAMTGWLSAYAFVKGLKAAGKNPTRAALVAALNDPKNANDTMQGLTWGSDTYGHQQQTKLICAAVVKVAPDGGFVPWKTTAKKPFLCWDFAPPSTPTTTMHR